MSRLDRHGAVSVLRPSGPLRADAIELLNEQVNSMLAGGVPYIVVDLSETPLIDGAGLEWILELDETCCRRGGCVRISNAGELCRDTLRITAVGSCADIFWYPSRR